MKQVYLVMGGVDCVDYEVLHVASSLEKAQAWEDAFKADTTNSQFDTWRIETWAIDDHNQNNSHEDMV